MTTYGSAFLDDIAETIEKLKKLTHNPYQPDDVRDILSSTGAKVEIFLKAVALPSESPKKTLEFFIDALPSGSIDSQHRSALHSLRNLYNKAKHEPTYEVQVLDAHDTIAKAELGLRQVVANGVGLSKSPRIASARRVYWISACDHYTSGETEVHIHIPGESAHWLGVPTFDHINIAGKDWDDVKEKLSLVGKLSEGRGIIPAGQFDAFISDTDSLNPIVFEGTYKDLLVTLASHELRLNLMHGLRREDNQWSMVVAALMATCDAALACSSPGNLTKEINQHATNSYGIPSNYASLDAIVQGMVQMVSLVPSAEWPNLHGPTWASESIFSAHSNLAIAKHPSLPILVTPNFQVIVKWSHS